MQNIVILTKPGQSRISCSSMSSRYRRDSDNERSEARPYQVKASARFVLISTMTSALVAFAVGRAARHVLLEGPRRAFLATYRETALKDRLNGGTEQPLPFIVAKYGEEIPHTRYTSKTFDTAKTTMSSSWLIKNDDEHILDRNDNHFSSVNTAEIDTSNSEEGVSDESKESQTQKVNAVADICDELESSQPTAEHLMVDMKNVDGAFLNSVHRLATAMIDVVNAANLTLLSYHCHGMQPTGVSCVGILMHNYISFHTWPDDGVITFDLVAAEGKSIMPMVPVIKENFGVPQAASYHGDVIHQPSMRWAHKLRGFHHRSTKISNLFQMTDLGKFLVSILGTEYKEQVTSVETDFQRIDIYDVTFKKTPSIGDGSYQSLHSDLFRPDRVLFLDGWLQSTRNYEAAYHEALVHPAVFVHPSPKRVAIIGGGECATLREVLKHNTVEKVEMIEIDKEMVSVSRESIPEWSDCSDLEGSARWCVDDPRTSMYYEDAHAWFMTRYSDEGGRPGDLDVIILDALDPEAEVPFAQALYGDDKFMRAFFNSLSDDGILIMQLGEAPTYGAPDETYSKFKNRASTTTLLATLGFQSIHMYGEAHCGFRAPWTYVVGFKSYATRQRWYANSGQLDLEIQRRGVRTKSGNNPFRYFDGPTMVSYQVPHRTKEAVFCRNTPTPKECRIGGLAFDPELPNVRSSSLSVKRSATGDLSGLGLFTEIDIKEDSYISAETNVQAVRFMPKTVNLIQHLAEEDFGKNLNVFNSYMKGHGVFSWKYGDDPNVMANSGVLAFVNHGCKGSFNTGIRTPFDEFTASLDVPRDEIVTCSKSHGGTTTFNPVIDRHLHFHCDQSLRDIQAGEEILDNFLPASCEANANEGQTQTK